MTTTMIIIYYYTGVTLSRAKFSLDHQSWWLYQPQKFTIWSKLRYSECFLLIGVTVYTIQGVVSGRMKEYTKPEVGTGTPKIQE